MASKTVTRKFVDGSEKTFQRKKQGRKPSGLGKLNKYRLYKNDEKRLLILKDKLGKYYNKNEIIHSAVKIYLDNFVPPELLKS